MSAYPLEKEFSKLGSGQTEFNRGGGGNSGGYGNIKLNVPEQHAIL